VREKVAKLLNWAGKRETKAKWRSLSQRARAKITRRLHRQRLAEIAARAVKRAAEQKAAA